MESKIVDIVYKAHTSLDGALEVIGELAKRVDDISCRILVHLRNKLKRELLVRQDANVKTYPELADAFGMDRLPLNHKITGWHVHVPYKERARQDWVEELKKRGF